jgi:membrane protease YdiL (CAAX protease family)
VLVLLMLLLPGLPLHVWPRPSGGDAVLWTLLVAAVGGAEELVFRGVLFDALQRIGGAVSATVACAIAFALLHVPLYGWRALPLDVGVGMWLGGLRMLSGGVTAPAVAHVVADCGAWLVL